MIRKLVRLKKKNGERGQSMAEFALIVPLFLLMVFAIIDFGMGLNAWITVTNSSREGARLGAVGGTSAQVTQKVKDTAAGLNQTKLTIGVTNAQGTSGSAVKVDVSYQYDLITPISSFLSIVGGSGIGSSLTVSSSAQMRIE